MTAIDAIEGIKQLNNTLKIIIRDQNNRDYALETEIKNKISYLLQFI